MGQREVPQTPLNDHQNVNLQETETMVKNNNHQIEDEVLPTRDCGFGFLPNVTSLTLILIKTFHSENVKNAIRNMKNGSSLFSHLKSKVPLNC